MTITLEALGKLWHYINSKDQEVIALGNIGIFFDKKTKKLLKTECSTGLLNYSGMEDIYSLMVVHDTLRKRVTLSTILVEQSTNPIMAVCYGKYKDNKEAERFLELCEDKGLKTLKI